MAFKLKGRPSRYWRGGGGGGAGQEMANGDLLRLGAKDSKAGAISMPSRGHETA